MRDTQMVSDHGGKRLSGRLYIVATPIGNLGDISKRSAEILASADLILAEDTRVTLKLLNHLGLKKRLMSCHEHNEAEREHILERANKSNLSVALVSDAGTPLVSDPGLKLVSKAIELGLDVVPIPGPSAFLLALIGSGFSVDRFVFEGFLPDRPRDAKTRMEELKDEKRTIVFYVAPHKLERTLSALLETFGDRPACLARELTKIHETFIRKSLSELKREIASSPLKGECVLVVRGAVAPEKPPLCDVDQKELHAYIKEKSKSGVKPSALASDAAKKFGMRRSEVYKLVVDFLNN
ncbi:MAG TPA: 16S rRNA (cytidine(1402)-2'-O)-methyltransferase [Candidatus Obscuribacterales bacterium]